MMIYPPIDDARKAVNGNKYVLTIIAAKEAKTLEGRPGLKARLATADEKSVSIALEEVYKGQIGSNNKFETAD